MRLEKKLTQTKENKKPNKPRKHHKPVNSLKLASYETLNSGSIKNFITNQLKISI
jgi:hypothetical protein